MNAQHFDVQQSAAAMARSAKQTMLLIPFGHLFIGGKRKKRELTWILLLCLYAVILSCGSPTD